MTSYPAYYAALKDLLLQLQSIPIHAQQSAVMNWFSRHFFELSVSKVIDLSYLKDMENDEGFRRHLEKDLFMRLADQIYKEKLFIQHSDEEVNFRKTLRRSILIFGSPNLIGPEREGRK